MVGYLIRKVAFNVGGVIVSNSEVIGISALQVRDRVGCGVPDICIKLIILARGTVINFIAGDIRLTGGIPGQSNLGQTNCRQGENSEANAYNKESECKKRDAKNPRHGS